MFKSILFSKTINKCFAQTCRATPTLTTVNGKVEQITVIVTNIKKIKKIFPVMQSYL